MFLQTGTATELKQRSISYPILWHALSFISGDWRIDQTSINIRSRIVHLYHAIDSRGNTTTPSNNG
ncbi:hypothetical protein DK867_11200 [Ochrobactrum sp. POC9]|nr:hypothetical protein DK867_11200 [Ochrobactrum sp. POC9]